MNDCKICENRIYYRNCQFIYLDLQTIAYVLYRAHQIASHMLVSIWLATLNRACARAI
jgi:hypothetical protein